MVGHLGLDEQPAEHLEPLVGARVAGVVHVERGAVLGGLVLPPRADDVEADPAGRDEVERRQRLGGQARRVVVGPDGDHQLEPLGDRGDRRRERPGVEGRRAVALDVVEVELGEQAQVEPGPLALDGERADVRPVGRHLLVADVAEPPAEHGHPVAEAHAADPTGTRRARSGVGPAVEERKARRVVEALRELGVDAHLERPAVYQFGVAVQLPDGRRAVWDADSSDDVSAQVLRDGVLVGFVPVVPGSGGLDEPGMVQVIAATDYDAPLGRAPRAAGAVGPAAAVAARAVRPGARGLPLSRLR